MVYEAVYSPYSQFTMHTAFIRFNLATRTFLSLCFEEREGLNNKQLVYVTYKEQYMHALSSIA